MQIQNKNHLLLKTIASLRFPLIIGVVLIHSSMNDIVVNGETVVNPINYPLFDCFSYFFSELLPSVSVPAFFFISGFLFFYKPIINYKTWLQKIQRRLHTLLVPYICWNLIVLLFYFIGETIIPQLFSGRNTLIQDYSIKDFLLSFWNGRTGMPINFPFWYIRDLMVTILFSYPLFYLIKKTRFYIVLLLGLLWFIDCGNPPTGFRYSAFFFFSFGAYFSINNYNFFQKIKPIAKSSIFIYLVSVITLLVFHSTGQLFFCKQINQIVILTGVINIFTVSARIISFSDYRICHFLSSSTFFLFAYHGIPLLLLKKIACKLCSINEITLFMIYLLCPVLIILGGALINFLLNKYLPRISKVLTGGR